MRYGRAAASSQRWARVRSDGRSLAEQISGGAAGPRWRGAGGPAWRAPTTVSRVPGRAKAAHDDDAVRGGPLLLAVAGVDAVLVEEVAELRVQPGRVEGGLWGDSFVAQLRGP